MVVVQDQLAPIYSQPCLLARIAIEFEKQLANL